MNEPLTSKPSNCRFCKEPINLEGSEAFWFNGDGPPPCYAVRCDSCGAQGPYGYGKFRGDHAGAQTEAVERWNEAPAGPVAYRKWTLGDGSMKHDRWTYREDNWNGNMEPLYLAPGASHETVSTLTPIEQLLTEWWATDMDNAELFNRAVRLSPALADAMQRLPLKSGATHMSKTLEDLIQGRHLPKSVIKSMEETEPGMLAKALEAMVYDRSHDKTMHTLYPEKVYLGNCRSEHMAQKIGVEKTEGTAGAVYGHYIKSDVVIAKVIALLDALALQHALERR
jgi:hypothetical protein